MAHPFRPRVPGLWEPLTERIEGGAVQPLEADRGSEPQAVTSPLVGPIPRPAWADEPRYRSPQDGGAPRAPGAPWAPRPLPPETAPWGGPAGRPWVRVYRGTGHPEYVARAPRLTPREKAVFLGRRPGALVPELAAERAPPAAVRAAAASLQAYARLTGEEGTAGATPPRALLGVMPAWGRPDALGRRGPPEGAPAPGGAAPTDTDPWAAGTGGFGGLGAGAAAAAAGADAERAPTVGNPAAWAALEALGPQGPQGPLGAGFTPASIRALKASHRAWAGRAVAVWVGVTLARPRPFLVGPEAVYRTLAEQNVTWAHPHGPAWWRRWIARRGRGALAPFLRRRRGTYGWTHGDPATGKARGPRRLARDEAYALRHRARVIRGLDTLHWAKPALPRGSYVGLAGVEIVHARKEAWKAARQGERSRGAPGTLGDPGAPGAPGSPGASGGPRGPFAPQGQGPRGPQRGPRSPPPALPAKPSPGPGGVGPGGWGGGWQPPVPGLDPDALAKRTERFVKVRRRGRVLTVLVRGRGGRGRR